MLDTIVPVSPGTNVCPEKSGAAQAELVAAGFDGFVEGLRAADCSERRGRPSLPLGRSSPVKNAEDAAIPGVSGRRKYSRLQGPCLLRANSLQIRAPVDACQAA
jgi:hypothetical protein